MKHPSKYVFISLVCILFVLSIFICFIPLKIQILHTYLQNQTSSKVRLHFITNWSEDSKRAVVLREVLKKFMMKYPDIEIINEFISGDYFLRKLKIDFVSGNDPDVFCLPSGSDMNALAAANKVAELDQILEEDKKWMDSFKEDVWAYAKYNDKIYGLPFEASFQCLFINKDLFIKYNIPIPQNFDELKYAVLAFRNERIIPIAYSGDSEGSLLYQNIIAKIGGNVEVSNPLRQGRINPCYVEGINYMKELYQLGAFPWEAFILDSGGSKELFIEKKAAMIVQGSWFISELSDNDDTIDILPFPKIQQENDERITMIYGLGSGTYHVSKKAWNDITKREGCIKLLKYLTSEEVAVKFIEEANMMVNVHVGKPGLKYNRLIKKGEEYVQNAKELIYPPDSFIDRSIWEGAIIKQLPYILDGTKNGKPIIIEDIWKDIEKQLKNK